MRTPPFAALALPGVAAALACGGGGAAGGARASRPAPAATPAVPAARLVPRVAKVPGTDLRFLDGGAGLPVVFVHGSLATLDSWRPQFDAFATGVRVVAYSRRYHPPNPARPDGQAYALTLHADDLIGLIEALRVERVHLVGSSYGAYVALLVTLKRPDLVRSLVLEEPLLLPWLARSPEGDSLRRAFEANVEEPARRAFARGDSAATTPSPKRRARSCCASPSRRASSCAPTPTCTCRCSRARRSGGSVIPCSSWSVSAAPPCSTSSPRSWPAASRRRRSTPCPARVTSRTSTIPRLTTQPCCDSC